MFQISDSRSSDVMVSLFARMKEINFSFRSKETMEMSPKANALRFLSGEQEVSESRLSLKLLVIAMSAFVSKSTTTSVYYFRLLLPSNYEEPPDEKYKS